MRKSTQLVLTPSVTTVGEIIASHDGDVGAEAEHVILTQDDDKIWIAKADIYRLCDMLGNWAAEEGIQTP